MTYSKLSAKLFVIRFVLSVDRWWNGSQANCACTGTNWKSICQNGKAIEKGFQYTVCRGKKSVAIAFGLSVMLAAGYRAQKKNTSNMLQINSVIWYELHVGSYGNGVQMHMERCSPITEHSSQQHIDWSFTFQAQLIDAKWFFKRSALIIILRSEGLFPERQMCAQRLMRSVLAILSLANRISSPKTHFILAMSSWSGDASQMLIYWWLINL